MSRLQYRSIITLIPVYKVCERDSCICRDLGLRILANKKVKACAAVYHAWLDWRWGCDR
jgi:hypothetical protein